MSWPGTRARTYCTIDPALLTWNQSFILFWWITIVSFNRWWSVARLVGKSGPAAVASVTEWLRRIGWTWWVVQCWQLYKCTYCCFSYVSRLLFYGTKYSWTLPQDHTFNPFTSRIWLSVLQTVFFTTFSYKFYVWELFLTLYLPEVINMKLLPIISIHYSANRQ